MVLIYSRKQPLFFSLLITGQGNRQLALMKLIHNQKMSTLSLSISFCTDLIKCSKLSWFLFSKKKLFPLLSRLSRVSISSLSSVLPFLPFLLPSHGFRSFWTPLFPCDPQHLSTFPFNFHGLFLSLNTSEIFNHASPCHLSFILRYIGTAVRLCISSQLLWSDLSPSVSSLFYSTLVRCISVTQALCIDCEYVHLTIS